MKSTAEVTTYRSTEGPMMTVATCDESKDSVEVYGDSDASRRAALAKLTDKCACGARWHDEE